jgi:predicted ester cyclase
VQKTSAHYATRDKKENLAMTNTELVQAWMRASEANDEAAVSELTADDFALIGATPQPLGKAEYIGFMHLMHAAFSDIAFNISRYEVNGDTVAAYWHFTATHTGTLALPGMPPIPATGKHVALGEEVQTCVCKDGKVQSFTGDSNPNVGIPGILAQLGVALPQ